MAIKVSCDNCENDLTTAGPYPAFRTTLSTFRMPHEGGFSFAVAVRPSLPEGERHFCGRKCLIEWIEKASQQGMYEN